MERTLNSRLQLFCFSGSIYIYWWDVDKQCIHAFFFDGCMLKTRQHKKCHGRGRHLPGRSPQHGGSIIVLQLFPTYLLQMWSIWHGHAFGRNESDGLLSIVVLVFLSLISWLPIVCMKMPDNGGSHKHTYVVLPPFLNISLFRDCTTNHTRMYIDIF